MLWGTITGWGAAKPFLLSIGTEARHWRVREGNAWIQIYSCDKLAGHRGSQVLHILQSVFLKLCFSFYIWFDFSCGLTVIYIVFGFALSGFTLESCRPYFFLSSGTVTYTLDYALNGAHWRGDGGHAAAIQC